MHEPTTDEELAALCLTDTSVFGALVDRYEGKLRNYIYRIGKLGPEDTEDLLQEVFIKVYQNLNAFDTSLKFSSWIYRIAHNETMAFFRKRRARPHGHALDVDEAVIANLASESDVLKESMESFDAMRLKEILGTLSREYYDVIILQFFEHKTYDEISDILAIPPGTVATRLSRAKAQIKKRMSSNGYVYA
jgi:RNA polymerase sigma-70 factor (ECF subfamily)